MSDSYWVIRTTGGRYIAFDDKGPLSSGYPYEQEDFHAAAQFHTEENATNLIDTMLRGGGGSYGNPRTWRAAEVVAGEAIMIPSDGGSARGKARSVERVPPKPEVPKPTTVPATERRSVTLIWEMPNEGGFNQRQFRLTTSDLSQVIGRAERLEAERDRSDGFTP